MKNTRANKCLNDNEVKTKSILKRENVDKTLKEKKDDHDNKNWVRESIMCGEDISTL